ncbi:MAG: YCF48-related protein [bacterium]
MKKSVKAFFLLLIFISVSPINIFAVGFNSIHTPDGVNIIAVGDGGKIFRSTNAGDTWASYNYGTDNFRSVFSMNNNVWIASTGGNIYKTSKTNSPVISYNVGMNVNINSVHFVNDNTGFACGDQGFIFKSVNGGINWSMNNSGTQNFNSISFLDANTGVAVGDNGRIVTTTNGGIIWSAQFVGGTTRDLLKVKYFAEGIVVVGTYGIIITKEGSGSWTPVVTRTDSDIRGISGMSYNSAHVCGGGGFIRNNSNGISNFFNFEVNPMMANLVDIQFYNSSLGFAVSSLNNAIIKTTNGGLTWALTAGTSVSYSWTQKSPSGSGIGNNLCMHPKDRNSAFVVYGNKVYVSRDRSETWTQISTISIGSRAHSFYVSPVDTNIWLAAIENTPDCVVRTTNYGATWTLIISRDFSTYGQPLEMDQNNPSTFYFAPSNAGGEGVYKSTNNGESFALVAPYNNTAINQPCDLIVMWDSSQVLFMGDDGADIFKSTNSAATWTLVKPASSSEVPSMCNSVFDKNICYATTWSSSQVFKTTNAGDQWNLASSNSGSGWGSDLCHEDPTLVLTGNYGTQAYLTTNSGANFFNVNTGLSGAGAGIMVPERGYLLNMQTGNLYKLVINYSVLTSANENIISSQVPSVFELSQNFPNPFNPATNIKFALPDAGDISLKVYDQLGKEVITLADGFRNAGTYEVSFDAGALTSGVYFYKLITKDIVSTKKMLLIK